MNAEHDVHDRTERSSKKRVGTLDALWTKYAPKTHKTALFVRQFSLAMLFRGLLCSFLNVWHPELSGSGK